MLAGQIGLDASSMTMVSPVDQASLALSHVKSVLNASRTSLNSGLFGLCYYTTVEAYQSAKVRDCILYYIKREISLSFLKLERTSTDYRVSLWRKLDVIALVLPSKYLS